jgi:hypothetical protein
MNQRIKNLLSEARLFCYDDGTVSLLGEDYAGQPEIQRFAELIVEECRYVMDCNKGSDQSQTWNQALSETSEKIKQHFGVE